MFVSVSIFVVNAQIIVGFFVKVGIDFVPYVYSNGLYFKHVLVIETNLYY